MPNADVIQARFMDQLGASCAADRWLDGVIDRLKLRRVNDGAMHPKAEITHCRNPGDSSVTTLWVDRKPVAQAIQVRDQMNWTQLTLVDMAPP